jgi:hypothetical protein
VCDEHIQHLLSCPSDISGREFALSFVLTFIKEVSETYKIHITTFRKDDIRRTQNFVFYLILSIGKFGLDFEG